MALSFTSRVLASLLLLATGATRATPADWCVRPEASEYAAADVRPMTGVETVHYATGAPESLGDDGQTFRFAADGLLESLTTHAAGRDDCETRFARDAQRRLERVSTPCNRNPSRVDKTYTYRGGTAFERDPNGTVASTVSWSDEPGGAWQMVRWNLDRQVSMARGATSTRHFDAQCRRIGVIVSRSDVTPARRWTATVEAIDGGHVARLHSESGLLQESTIDLRGFVVREYWLRLNTVSEFVYVVDPAGNWTERRETFRQAVEGEADRTGERTVRREITYRPVPR